MKITLNETEQSLARMVAVHRHSDARAKNVPNMRLGPQSNAQTDLDGAGAEIAYCKLHNCYPDLGRGEMPYADAFTVEHGAVDVKCTKYRQGMLLARRSKQAGERPDSYVLMIGEFPTYRYVGWLSADALLQDENLRDLGYGETFAMPQDGLNP